MKVLAPCWAIQEDFVQREHFAHRVAINPDLAPPAIIVTKIICTRSLDCVLLVFTAMAAPLITNLVT